MLFICRPLLPWTSPEILFPTHRRSQAPPDMQGKSSSFGSNTQDYLKHPFQMPALTCYSTGVFEALCAFVTTTPKGLFREILKPGFPAEYSVRETKLHQTVIIRNCAASGVCWGVYFPHLLPPLEKAEGVFSLVCLLLRSTIIGETSKFLKGYFSSVFFLYFVYSPNTVTSQFMKVFASDV